MLAHSASQPELPLVLLVEDDANHVELIERAFEDQGGFSLRVVSTVAAAREELARGRPDLVISDMRLPDGEGTDLGLQQGHDRAPLVVMTSHGSEEVAVRVMKAGALDYVVKSPDAFADMPHVAGRALREWDHIVNRRRAEEEREVHARESARQREFAESLVATARAIILVLDPEGRVLRFNPYLERLAGVALDDAVGACWFTRFVPEDSRSQARASFESVRDGRSTGLDIVSAITTTAGERLDIEWAMSQLRDPAGAAVGVLGVGSDITQRLRAEQEEARLRERLLEHERLAAVGTAAAMLAHEISNPLNNMFLHAQLVERRLKKLDALADPRVGAGVGNIVGEIRRLSALLDEFRSLSRRQKLAIAPVDLGELVTAVVEGQQPLYAERAIDARVEIRGDDCVVPGDGEKLRQVLINLCKNACEAMDAGGTLTLAVEPRADQVVVRVRDTGVGIPEGVDVFEPFHTSKDAGTGLGLPIVRQIVEAHGGSIRFESEPGVGTTFICEFRRTRS